MNRPPKVIRLIFEAVCIFLDVEPVVTKGPNGEYKSDYWQAAQSKDVLGNPKLSDILVDFDRNKITQEKMAKIETILSDYDYTYENAYSASKSATGIFKWVKAIRDYYYIF